MWIAYSLLLLAAVAHGIVKDVYNEYNLLIKLKLTARQLRDLYCANIVITGEWTLATAYKRHTLCAAVKYRLADMGEKL